MIRRPHAWTSVALLALIPAAARAEHAKINLDVTTPRGQESAFVDQTPPASGKIPRPVIKAKAGETIKVQWIFTNIYPHKTLEDVVVHFYVAREGKAGQKDLPDLSNADDVVLETAYEMDFKPGAKSGARASFKIDKPGSYLVRVDSKQTKSDHEHFAAIDLVIEE